MSGRVKAFLDAVRARLKNRPDSEHEQAIVRLALVSIIVGYLTITDWAGHESTRHPVLYVLFGLYLAVAVGLLIEICRRPEACPRRRIIGMVGDNVAIATCMYLTTELGAPLFGVFLFVTFGNGFRYGRFYLFASQALAIAGFGAVLLSNPYWHDQVPLGLGLMFSMVILPLYVSTLLTRIQKSRAAAEAANVEKTRFLSTMSHEMRTPLNGVIGINELLFATPLSPEQRELLRSSQSSAQLMLSLVSNILDISRVESGRLELERIEFDLHKLLHTTLRTVQIEADRRNLALNLNVGADVPYQLVGSPLHVRQILVNLTSNALKFTESGSVSVRVSAQSGTGSAARLRFEVADTGIGIALEALPRIFERFYQADQSITRVYGGSGLGTAISKQLAELMGGEIGVKSELGKGSLFWFELPFERAATKPEPQPSLPGLRVNLLVSEPPEVAALTASLVGWGMTVEVSAGAPELVRALANAARQNRAYHMVLIDARALRMDPIQLAATVRSGFELHPPMLVLLNSAASGRERDALLRAGYASFLDSPVDKGRLFNIVHSAVAKEDLPLPETVISITAGARGRRTTARSVLVAEDNPTNRLVVQKVLEGAGHDVTTVDNGEQVLDALEQGQFDCVIVDWHMPVMGGLEALKLVRMMERQGERTPFIMFTANATREAMDECAAAGFDAFLTKPIEPKRLLDTVATLCPEQRASGRRPMIASELSSAPEAVGDSAGVVDLEKLKELEGIGRSGFVADLVAGFLADGEKLIAAMSESVREADYKGFREQVHALKGSAGSLGADALYKKCREVSQVLPRELPVKAEKVLSEIERSFVATRGALDDYVAKHLRAAG
ncbi:MAG TPA: ATP-binding protein [Burkholderiales bacterium]|nr:ATP-binding protein [Burkholderiales bacterium]